MSNPSSGGSGNSFSRESASSWSAAAVPDHANIVVQDMERAVRFYSEALGLQKSFETTLEGDWIEQVTGLSGARAHCIFLESPAGGIRLELLHYLGERPTSREGLGNPQLPGLRHLAFRVDDIEQFVERARSAGADFVSDPVTVPFPLPGGLRKRLCYFHDLEGVLIEAAEYCQPEEK